LFAPTGLAEGTAARALRAARVAAAEQPDAPEQRPKARANPAARVFQGGSGAIRHRERLPRMRRRVYRLTEHFHYWTKNVVDLGDHPAAAVRRNRRRAREGKKAIADGDWVKVSSKTRLPEGRSRSWTPRIASLDCGRQESAHGGAAEPLGLRRSGPGRWVSGQYADALQSATRNTQTPGVQVLHREPRERPEGGCHVHRFNRSISAARSATTFPSPSVRREPRGGQGWIDVNQLHRFARRARVACMQWNDLRDSVGGQRRNVRQSARSDAGRPGP